MSYFVYNQPHDYGDRKGRTVYIVFDKISVVTKVKGLLEIWICEKVAPAIISCPVQAKDFMDLFIHWLDNK